MSSETRRHFIAGSAAAVAALAAVPALAAGKTIKIGFVYDLSGAGALYGQRAKEAAAVALADVNAPGVLPAGVSIEAHFEDSKSSPQEAVSAAQLLIERDNIDVLVPDTSSDTLAVLGLGTQYKIPIVNCLASARKITESDNRYIFRIIPNEVQQNIFLATFVAKNLKKPDIFIAYETTDQGIGQRDAFAAKYAELGGKVIDQVSFPPDQTDFSSIATRIKSKNPAMLYAATSIQPMVRLVKSLAEQGSTIPVTSTVWLAYPTFETLAGPAANNHVRLTFWMASKGPDASPETVDFTKKFEAKYGKVPDYNHAEVYEAIQVIADAVKRGGRDRASIVEKLRQTKNFPGLMGPVSFDANGQIELTPRSMLVIRSVNGKAVVLASQ